MAYSKLIISCIAALLITLGYSNRLFGFVRDDTCEAYGMHSIHDPVYCHAAALLLSAQEGLRTDTKFFCHPNHNGPDHPIGCSYHQYGNIELWGDTTGDCDVNGYGGCFCLKDSFGFVRTGTCESNGMQSIHDPIKCELAARTIATEEGLKSDYNFAHNPNHHGPNAPTGCSYHPSGNVEAWGDTTGDCNVNGYEGCFCIKGCN
eukprot:62722_1